MVGCEPAQIPTSTTSRFPLVMALGTVTARLADPAPWPVTCWTKETGGAGEGVTLFDGADAGPVPRPLAAVTVKVYAVPLVSPVTVADVTGGLPVTVVVDCA